MIAAHYRERQPLSHTEQRIWRRCQADPQAPYYIHQGRIVIEGTLDETAFCRAWQAVLERHGSLRSGFGRGPDGAPFKYRRPPSLRALDFTDLSRFSPSEWQELIARQARDLRDIGHNLESDELFQFRFYRCGKHYREILISFHEIALTPSSVSVLLNDLKENYKIHAGPAETADLNLSVATNSIAVHRRKSDAPEHETAARSFWSGQLPEESAILSLLADNRPSATRDYRSASESMVLDPDVTRALRAMSQAEGVPLGTLLLSAIQLLLRRYAGQDDIIVGVAVDNCPATAVGKVGCFLSMLPIRARISERLSFRAFLRANHRTVSTALSYADFPFDHIADRVRSMSDLGAPSLFQVTFNMFECAPIACAPNTTTLTYGTMNAGYMEHDLAFRVHDSGEIKIEIAYLTQLFDADTIWSKLENLATLLRSTVARPDHVLNDLDYIASRERHNLLHGFNRTDTNFAPPQSIQQLFEEQARRTPTGVAFYSGGKSLSFECLNERSNRLANFLKRRGVKRGMRVGICVERSFDTAVGLMGIIKTGATYVPLDAQLPVPRLTEIIQDCGLTVLLLHRDLDGFDDFHGQKVFIDTDWDRIASASAENPPADRTKRRILNVIYTSATTGKPKGVIVSESAVLNRLHWMWKAYPFEPGDVGLVQKSSSLVASTWELFGGLLQGIPSVILSYGELFDPARLWQVCQRHGITHFLATPALIECVLLQAVRYPGEWHTLRFATTSAEPISTTMVRRWYEAFPNVPLLNLYGATECASNATVYDTRELGAKDLRVPLGKPIANVQAYILDERLNLLPRGAVGELCIGGACLAEGYLGLPDLTNERFVENPFSPAPRSRLYRTGDLARIRSDGKIEFIGRRDNQVNIRGFRVELEDVEAVLETHPGVKQAVVVLAEPSGDGGALTAFVTLGENAKSLGRTGLKAFVAARLPSYMVPAHFAFIDEIPLTRQNKVDRLSLRRRCAESREELSYIAPKTETEIRLAQIWKELLKIERVGLDDDFFDLGGHSLLAVRLFSEINRVFEKDLPLSTLYQSRSLQRLARVIAENDVVDAWPTLTAVTPRSETGPAALFCVHGIFGDILSYRYLANGLGPNQPLYGLQPRTLAGRPVDYTSVQDLAASYVAAIKAFQPSGPYYLAGYSYGARIALEMAQILRQQGTPPALLISLDGHARERVDLRVLHEENIGILGIDEARAPSLRFAQDLRSNYFIWRIYMFFKGLSAMGIWLIRQAYFALDLPLPRCLRTMYTEEVLRRIARDYRPAPYDGRTIVFCTPLRRKNLVKDWRAIAGSQAHFVDIRGSHVDVFEAPNIRRITSRLNEELRGDTRATAHNDN